MPHHVINIIKHFIQSLLIIFLFPLNVQAALPKELPAAPEKFLTGACLTRSEDLWITAEAGGVYRLSGQEMKPKWEDMRKQPGFPKTDNCTAVCEDSQGRIWVGTANAGVQVFHKGQWKRYDRDTVLGGSHVHARASTLTGHFWSIFLKLFHGRLDFFRDDGILSSKMLTYVDCLHFYFDLFASADLFLSEKHDIVWVQGNHFPALIPCTHTP